MMGEQTPPFGGYPVAPDVKLLMDHFGTLDPGTEIEHQTVERLLGLKATQNRYRAVTARWMRDLWDDRNVRVVGIRGGFRVLTAEQRLDQSERQRRKGVRRLTQAVKEVVTTPLHELPPEQQRRHEHLARTNVLALSHVKEAQRSYGLALKGGREALPKPAEPNA